MARKNDLSKVEQENVRLALRFLRTSAGKWESLGKMLGIAAATIRLVTSGANPVSASMAFRVARFANISIDNLLAGKYPPAGTCPYCGHRDETLGETVQ